MATISVTPLLVCTIASFPMFSPWVCHENGKKWHSWLNNGVLFLLRDCHHLGEWSCSTSYGSVHFNVNLYQLRPSMMIFQWRIASSLLPYSSHNALPHPGTHLCPFSAGDEVFREARLIQLPAAEVGHCLCAANPSAQAVQRTPAEPWLVRPCW